MDNVITSLIVLDGDGAVNEYVGGYSDWEARGGSLSDARAKSRAMETKQSEDKALSKQKKIDTKKTKLTYKDQRELGNLPGKIEKLEDQQLQLEEKISVPGFYQSGHENIQRVTSELARVQAKLEVAYERWAELEDT